MTRHFPIYVLELAIERQHGQRMVLALKVHRRNAVALPIHDQVRQLNAQVVVRQCGAGLVAREGSLRHASKGEMARYRKTLRAVARSWLFRRDAMPPLS